MYLSDAGAGVALALPRALAAAAAAASAGPEAALAAAAMLLDAASASDPPVELDYLTLADPATFVEAGPDYTGPALLLVAARVGSTRLIDNTWLTFGRETAAETAAETTAETAEPGSLENHAAHD